MRDQMRRRLSIAAALPLIVVALCAAPPRAATADDADLSGTYKFVMITVGEAELFLMDVKQEDGKLSPTITESSPNLPGSKAKSIEQKGDKVRLDLMLGTFPTVFTGKLDKDGKVQGSFRVQGQTIAARLEKTDAKKLTDEPDRAFFQQFLLAQKTQDPQERSKKFAAMIEKDPGNPKLNVVYTSLLKDASAAGMTEAEAQRTYEEWVKGTKRYGDDFADAVRTQALEALTGQKELAGLALRLATEIDEALAADAPVETRAEVIKALASAAKLAGKDDIAAKAEARSEKLEGELDEEYHKTVPPFKPESFEGRKEKTDRVVLLELFTGAQCPPCVAADVAFDSLISTYKPTELITLQYHLHIPRADPLTNADSFARADYYPSLRGTPATYFNGEALAGGGGPMDNAQNKYNEYRKIIDKDLDDEKRATIDLQVTRNGDDVKIVASAEAKPRKAKGDDKDGGKEDRAADKGQIRLRLALVEEQIRYLGGNRLRLHHHVVRAMPGGVEGKALTEGQGKTEVTLKLSDVRAGLETYLSDYDKSDLAKQRGPLPNPLPAIKLDDLSVVAFVQDDSDKSVLHAVSAPVGAAKP